MFRVQVRNHFPVSLLNLKRDIFYRLLNDRMYINIRDLQFELTLFQHSQL